MEREHKMIIANFPQSSIRRETILLSLGTQGVFLDADAVLQGRSFAYGSSNEERIEWSALPTAVEVLNPFVISCLSDSSVEIHSLASLVALQKISISTPSTQSLSFAVYPEEGIPPVNSLGQHVYVCNGDQLTALKMVPLATQVEALVAANCHEEALSICQVCENKNLIVGIDVRNIYEANAFSLLSKGDFEKAVQNFLLAKTDFLTVASNFPDFIPHNLQNALSINPNQGKKYTGAVLQRAAAAVALLCDGHRSAIIKRAEKAEKVRELGFMASSSAKPSFSAAAYKNASFSAATVMGTSISTSMAQAPIDENDEDYIANPDEEIGRAILCDTMYLFALMNCSPPKKSAVIDLLKSSNRCQIESCSVLLASNGDAYIEALLWLYRSQNQHARVLAALTEDKCVTMTGWTREQFYRWTAEYLQWLWYHEDDLNLPKQALISLKPVLEYDAELGLCVLVCRPVGKTSFGGKGVTITEVLNFLRSTSPKLNYSRGQLNFGANNASSSAGGGTGKLSKEKGVVGWQNEKVVSQVLSDAFLANGHSLAVAFLECLVSSGEAPANMHDEFAQLLVEGLPMDSELENINHDTIDLADLTTDSETLKLYKIYRRKLQAFLSVSPDYHPQRVLKFLPRAYLQENALVLSRLGRHREVLKIYLHQLSNQDLAETYCTRIYGLMTGDMSVLEVVGTSNTTASSAAAAVSTSKSKLTSKRHFSFLSAPIPAAQCIPINLSAPGEIYLLLFEVILEEEEEDEEMQKKHQRDAKFNLVVSLAEKYYDRFDVNAFLELLPRNTPVSVLLKYFQIVYEYQGSRKRNLQIVHQLLRTREVYLRTVQSTSDQTGSTANAAVSGRK
jgi:hypothetical protein